MRIFLFERDAMTQKRQYQLSSNFMGNFPLVRARTFGSGIRNPEKPVFGISNYEYHDSFIVFKILGMNEKELSYPNSVI